MLGWRKTAAVAISLWLMTASAVAAGDEMDLSLQRAEKPAFAAAWVAYQQNDEAYYDCVEGPKSAALQDMWRRHAPLEGAVYALSRAYRECPGFETFWPTLYFAGFDSPEQWIEYELRVIRAAVIASAKIDAEDHRRSGALLRDAIDATTDAGLGERAERLQARDQLLDHYYAATAFVLDRPLDEDEAELVMTYPDRLTSALPEGAVDALQRAVTLAAGYRNGVDIAMNLAQALR